ncbi:phage tail protein [Bradyrhizobium cenepequi]
MTADAYSLNLGLILQGTGNNNNWGTICNNSMVTPTDRAIAGVNTISDVGGTVDLSTIAPPAGLRLDLDYVQLLNGALTSHLTVVVPNVSKSWWFQNKTTGNFNVYVKTPSGNPIQIPQGSGRMVMGDGSNNLTRHDDDEIGSIRMSAKAAIGAGELACNGASLLKADFPNLYGKIGTTWGSADSLHFTLPNFTDTARFLRSSSGTLAVGTYQASAVGSHTHPGAAFSGTTSAVSNDHTHNFSGVTGVENQAHTHNYNPSNVQLAGATGGGNISLPIGDGNATSGTENQQHNHNFSGTTSGISANHTHSYGGTTGTIPASGGSETRPESAVVLFGIRY